MIFGMRPRHPKNGINLHNYNAQSQNFDISFIKWRVSEDFPYDSFKRVIDILTRHRASRKRFHGPNFVPKQLNWVLIHFQIIGDQIWFGAHENNGDFSGGIFPKKW